MLATSLMYAANYSIAKVLMPFPMSSYALVLTRLLCASLILFMVLFITKPPKPDWRKDGLLFFWCALTGVVINMLLFFKGLSLSTAIDAAIIMTLTPPVTYAISVLSKREPLSGGKIIGAAIAMFGVWMLVSKFSLRMPEINLGNLLLLINAIAYAFYIPAVKQLGRTYDSISICAWTFTIALPLVAVFGLHDLLLVPWSTFSLEQGASLGFVVIGVTVLTYLFIAYSAKKLSSTTVSFYSYVQPVFAVIIAAFFTNEIVTINHLASGGLVLVGLGMLNFSFKKD
jgi:drug/metabolite transporter (DMT)-like permease